MSLFALTLTCAFAARGMAYACAPQQASVHDCCGKSAPAAPKTPCPEMACCQVVPTNAAPTPQHNDLPVMLPVAVFIAQALDNWHAVPASSDNGPPGPRILSVSDRSPPDLLG